MGRDYRNCSIHHHWSARRIPRHALKPGAPHAHGTIWEKERMGEREIQQKAGSPRSCGCCARDTSLWLLQLLSVLRDAERWLRMTLHCVDDTKLNHRGGSVEKRAIHRFQRASATMRLRQPVVATSQRELRTKSFVTSSTAFTEKSKVLKNFPQISEKIYIQRDKFFLAFSNRNNWYLNIRY